MKQSCKIVVHPGGDDRLKLSVKDALKQVLDFMELLEAAKREGNNKGKYDWILEDVAMNSPLATRVVAYNKHENSYDVGAEDDVARANAGWRDLNKGIIPVWLSDGDVDTFKRILKRNLNGVGCTEILWDEENAENRKHADKLTVENAGKILKLLNRDVYSLDTGVNLLDAGVNLLKAYGDFIGVVSSVYNYRNKKPALNVRPIIGNKSRVVTCLLSDRLVDVLGDQHTYKEVWENRRVSVHGMMQYDRNGDVVSVNADKIEYINSRPIHAHEIIDKDFTGGMSAREYLEKFREGDV